MCRGANISPSLCPRPSLSFFSIPVTSLFAFPFSWPSLFRFEFNDGKCTLAKSISCSFPPSSLSLRSPFLYALPLAAPSVLLVATVCPRLDRRFFGRINLIKTIRYETFFIEREEWAAVLRYGLATNDVHRFVSFPFLPFHLSKNIVAMPRKSFAFRSRDVFVDGRGEDGGFFYFENSL